MKIHGRTLEPRVTQFSVLGEKGRFTFRSVNPDGSIHCWGGKTGHLKLRDIRIDRIKTIHNQSKEKRP